VEISVPAHAGKRSGIGLPNYAGQASYVEGIGRLAEFFAQSSALITHRYKPLNAEPLNRMTDAYCFGLFAASCPQAAEISCPLLRRIMTV
jgi:hypothetical protein